MVVVAFLFLTFLGYFLLSFFKNDFPFFGERLCLGFLLGIGLTTFLMFLGGLLKVSLTSQNIIFCLFFLDAFVFLLLLGRGKINLFCLHSSVIRQISQFSLPKFSFFEKLMVFLLLFFVFWSFLQTLTWPPFSWDTLSLYDFRARRFAETHSLARQVLTVEPELTTYTYCYPFFTSLAHALVYILGGENPKFIYSLFYLVFLACFYFVLKRVVSRQIALFATLLIASNKSFLTHSTIAYANLPYAVYFVLSTIFLWQYLKVEKKGFLFLAAFFLAFSTWVRSTEPFWVVNFFFLFFFLFFKKRFLPLAFFSFVFLIIRQSWKIYYQVVVRNISDPRFIPTRFSFDFSKILPVTVFFFDQVVWVKEWFLFLLLFVFALPLAGRRIKKFWPVPLFVFSYFAIFWAGVYYFSVNYSWWNKIGGSAGRTSFFFVPLLLYASIILVFEKPVVNK